MDLIDASIKFKADVILISQVVTQGNIHHKHLKEFKDCFDKSQLPSTTLVGIGGPFLKTKEMIELGFENTFKRGVSPKVVAGWIAKKVLNKK